MSGLEYAWPILGVSVLTGIVTTAVWARRVRTSIAASLAAGGFGADLVVNLIGKDGPAEAVGFTEGFLAGLLLVSEVVLALWLHGNYRLEVGHRVSVWLLPGRSGHEPDFYQAFCECTWESDQFEVEDGDDSEERAFEVAREHSPTVRSDVAVRL